MGGALATLESAAEESFVYGVFALFRRTHFYIGLTDEGSEGSFHTLDGRPPLYSRWSPGEPNNTFGNENCVELSDLGWNDVPCEGDTKNAFVCELP